MEIVVRTTTRALRMPGTVTFTNCSQALVPSSSAASICSVGTPLMAADSTTMANPVCTQMRITMRNRVLNGDTERKSTGCPPNMTTSWFSRPICSWSAGRAV